MSDAKNIRSIVSPATTDGDPASREAAEDHVYELLKFVGEDPDREGPKIPIARGYSVRPSGSCGRSAS
jgi:hypothetical protein